MTEHRTLAEVVGENSRRLRTNHGATLDQVATTARLYGVKWSTARVVELERGRLPISAPLLFLLPQVLGDAIDHRVSIAELLAGDYWIELNEETAIHSEILRKATVGEKLDWAHEDYEGGAEEVRSILSGMIGALTQNLPPAGTRATLAEVRAAKKIGISVEELQDVALYLWGEPLGHVIRQGVDRDASPQARGHVTRALVAELQSRLPDIRERIRADREADG